MPGGTGLVTMPRPSVVRVKHESQPEKIACVGSADDTENQGQTSIVKSPAHNRRKRKESSMVENARRTPNVSNVGPLYRRNTSAKPGCSLQKRREKAESSVAGTLPLELDEIAGELSQSSAEYHSSANTATATATAVSSALEASRKEIEILQRLRFNARKLEQQVATPAGKSLQVQVEPPSPKSGQPQFALTFTHSICSSAFTQKACWKLKS